MEDKINEIIMHMVNAFGEILAADSKLAELDLSNIPQGNDLKKKIRTYFVESVSKFELSYNVLRDIKTGKSSPEIIECKWSLN